MPVFQWTGRTPRGGVQSGEMKAKNKEEVVAQLRRQNITPSNITPKKSFSFGRKKASEKDIVVFTRQFATMIDAGLPLVQALEILAKQTENPSLADVIAQVKVDVESGATYADSLRRQPKTFDALYANMVAAGEAGGILDTILSRLAAYIEKSMKLKKQVKGAMIYPAVIITVAVAVIAIILIKVIPVFQTLFAGLGADLPVPTKVILAISHFLSGWGGLVIVISIVASVVTIRQIRKTEKGRYVMDSWLLKAPVFGPLLRKVAVAKFTRTMGTLVSSGVPILDGLDICAKTAGNKRVEYAVYDVKKAVSEGKTLAEPLEQTEVFPPMVNQMIAVGESTGALDAMLSKIADFYDDEVDAAVANLTSLMEPLLMVFLGTTIGFIVIAMYMPIFKMITVMSS